MPSLLQLEDVRPAHLGLSLVVAAAGLGLLYIIALQPIYNLLFHPLRKYPGPKFWAVSRLPYLLNWVGGRSSKRILELHHKYGSDIIRVAPDELSFLRPDAWKEVMGHLAKGQLENEKDRTFFEGLDIEHSVLGAGREKHRHMRSILAHGFSAVRMQEQQPLITRYIDLLMERLRDKSASVGGESEAVDIVSWYNYTTFDIVGDLTFGESFDCLDSSTLHPWVSVIFKWLKLNSRAAACRRAYPLVGTLIDVLFGKMATAMVREHMDLVRAKVDKRLGTATDRPDFVNSMLREDKGPALSRRELDMNANLLIVAGSETTATILSFATFLLLTHPRVLQKVTDEVMAAFAREDEINFNSVQSLKYMLAVFDEALRVLPPVPTPIPRVVPPGGRVICGEHLPENTKLGIWQYAMNHHPGHFVLPEEFIPERWLGEDARFAQDQREAFQPFSYGSRNCLGKNLAYAEMRTIMARMLFNFEMRLREGGEDWAEKMEIHNLWEKKPLMVHLTPRTDQDRARLRSGH